MRLHLEKKAIRALGIAESFRKGQEYSTLAGVVMRSDYVIDGFALSRLKVSGSDATSSTVGLFTKLDRNDVNSIMISGSVLSLYNVLDIDKLHKQLKLPIVALSFKRSTSDLARNVRSMFPAKEALEKIKLLTKLGSPTRLKLRTGYAVFVRMAGIDDVSSAALLDKFTLQGSVPEPVRVARLFAKTVATNSN
jgi:endonuclease V-like protein UPF0215 family